MDETKYRRAVFPKRGGKGIVRVDRTDAVLILTKDMQLEVVLPDPSSYDLMPQNVVCVQLLFRLLANDPQFLNQCAERFRKMQMERMGILLMGGKDGD